MSGVANLRAAALMFDWVEYSVFSTMLILSLLIGVYYGWFKKQDTVAEYMLGGKKMSIFPVTMSLIFSHISGITLLGVPAEIYTYGSQFFAISVCIIITFLVTNYLYLPVFYHLQMVSVYEYLELRFNQGVRTLGSLIFALSVFLYVPVVIYIPALAFNQVTGISVSVVSITISIICIFYTSFGGLKAVVWTDALQGVFTLGSVIFVVVLGFMRIGSISEVIRINFEGHRIEPFNMDPNPFVRMSFWTYAIGAAFNWSANISIHAGAMQRFIAVSTFKKAKAVMAWTTVGFSIIHILVVVVGLLVYATYHDCDPVVTGRVQKVGQILPMYVVDVAKNFPGITGLFISGALSAALSTMSASLNTVAGTLYEDFFMYVLKGKKLPETQQNFITKVIVLVLGVIGALMVMVVEKLGAIYQVGMGVQGVTNGTLLGLFSLGIFFPRANSKGALVGTLASVVAMCVIIFGSQYYTLHGMLKYPGKATSVDGCPTNYTSNLGLNVSTAVDSYTGIGSPVVADESVSLIFQLSFLYYALTGSAIVVLVGLVVSYLTEPEDPKSLDPQLFSPCVRQFLPNKTQKPPHSTEDYKMISTNPGLQDEPEVKAAA